MKKMNLISGLLVLIIGVLMVIDIQPEKTYELTITDENGISRILIMTDEDNDGYFEFVSYKVSQ